MLRRLHKAHQKPVGVEGLYTQADQDKAVEEFKAITGKPLPVIDITKVQVNDFSPFLDKGETTLEPYNRCLNLLMYLHWSINTANWLKEFGSKQWGQECTFSKNDVPHWMRPKTATGGPGVAPDQATPSLSADASMSPKEIRIVWNHSAKVDYAEELWEEVGEDLSLIYERNMVFHSTATGAEIRDQIRAAFNMDVKGAQIKTLMLLPERVDVIKTTWKHSQEELWAADTAKTSLSMTLRKTEEGEGVWENEPIPRLTRSILVVDDDDVRPAATDPTVPAPEEVEPDRLGAFISTLV